MTRAITKLLGGCVAVAALLFSAPAHSEAQPQPPVGPEPPLVESYPTPTDPPSYRIPTDPRYDTGPPPPQFYRVPPRQPFRFRAPPRARYRPYTYPPYRYPYFYPGVRFGLGRLGIRW